MLNKCVLDLYFPFVSAPAISLFSKKVKITIPHSRGKFKKGFVKKVLKGQFDFSRKTKLIRV
jgi:hypothetical protein